MGASEDFIQGENSSVFDHTTLALLGGVPESRGDPDQGAVNEGVSILRLE
jgi:hypothetical protein